MKPLMKTLLNLKETIAATNTFPIKESERLNIQDVITESWQKIAPFWPLKNLIAVNPLQGLEDLSIEQAMVEGAAYFQQQNLPQQMEKINLETIKWCQAFFDEGQATIPMPFRKSGLYSSWRRLILFDDRLHGKDINKRKWLVALPQSAEGTIAECLLKLSIPLVEHRLFLTMLLTTLPGWAAHIKYRCEWTEAEPLHPYPVTQADYLAMRIVIACLLWPEASELISWHKTSLKVASQMMDPMITIVKAETEYRLPLLNNLVKQAASLSEKVYTPAAQLVFCIDVRSEPFRRALEARGNYETFGFAGFFGVPVRIEDEVTGESYASCPVLLKPKHKIKERPVCLHELYQKHCNGYKKLNTFKSLYQSTKYTFTTPFALMETLGIASGIWMGLRSFAPKIAMHLKTRVITSIYPNVSVTSELDDISFENQCTYAEGALCMMGMTNNFAPLIVLCGHGSATQNNAYATLLDCGACGGRHGASNARILSAILNNIKIRKYLSTKEISIPDATYFIAAEHNTTTDDVELYTHGLTDPNIIKKLQQLKNDLEVSRKINSKWRSGKMGYKGDEDSSSSHTALRSVDWAQVRPEWGLARNASFIIAPRNLTKGMNLEGRSFLHSYDWQQDLDGGSLTTILMAPMVVAQWINSQYLFSTLDNVAYGGGSKVTKNITGKIGIMQGNASDLMHGLPLQSVYRTDTESYHQPLRLMTVVYAPRSLIDNIIAKHAVLQKLFGKGWVTVACIEPREKQLYMLERDLTWRKVH